MRKQNLIIGLSAITFVALLFTAASAQTSNTNPRYGQWKLKSDAAPPSSNIMTYEPFNGKGMKITIDSVGRDGNKSQWYYTTMFDGKDETVTGNTGTDTGAVKIITDRINEITYKKNGKISQLLTNVLSPDGNTIGVMYMRMDANGNTTGVSFATYQKIQ